MNTVRIAGMLLILMITLLCIASQKTVEAYALITEFDVTITPDNHVRLSWFTQREEDNLGYLFLRSTNYDELVSTIPNSSSDFIFVEYSDFGEIIYGPLVPPFAGGTAVSYHALDLQEGELEEGQTYYYLPIDLEESGQYFPHPWLIMSVTYEPYAAPNFVLSSFSAEPNPEEQAIELSWTTGIEEDIVAYRLLRSESTNLFDEEFPIEEWFAFETVEFELDGETIISDRIPTIGENGINTYHAMDRNGGELLDSATYYYLLVAETTQGNLIGQFDRVVSAELKIDQLPNHVFLPGVRR